MNWLRDIFFNVGLGGGYSGGFGAPQYSGGFGGGFGAAPQYGAGMPGFCPITGAPLGSCD